MAPIKYYVDKGINLRVEFHDADLYAYFLTVWLRL